MMRQSEETEFYQQVLAICLTAGRLMIVGGSEMYRVEDTMLRIARNAGVRDPRVFATPTGVFMSLAGGELSQMIQVRERNMNLELVDRVNGLSREFANHELDFAELKDRIEAVETTTPSFPLWLQVLGAAALSATLMVLFMNDYDWIDFPAAAGVGSLGFLAYVWFKQMTRIRFISELLATIVMGLLALLLHHFFPVTTVANILIGGLMTLVPGVALTNALRDLFMGDLLSGIVRLVEAGLTAVSLGAGVALVIKFFGA